MYQRRIAAPHLNVSIIRAPHVSQAPCTKAWLAPFHDYPPNAPTIKFGHDAPSHEYILWKAFVNIYDVFGQHNREPDQLSASTAEWAPKPKL